MAKKMISHDLDETTDGSNTEHLMHEKAVAERYPTGFLVLHQDSPPEQWPTSLEVGSAHWKAMLVNCLNTPDVVIGAEWSDPFIVVDWLVLPREDEDEDTGEVRRYPWLVLICADGKMVGTSSKYAPKTLARVLRAYTPDEWRRGIPLSMRRRLNRAGDRSYHELRVAE